jgi:hypothetical protein
MNTTTLQFEYKQRLHQVLNTAWTVFKSQFINNRYLISTEAPFQFHFADVIKKVGNLYCLKREDQFLVDLETRCKNIKGKTKYFDITCEFLNQLNCAIELKFKTSIQGAQDHGRIDIYSDIEALEIACKDKFSLGKLYVITDSAPYVNQSKIGVGTVFPTHHQYTTEPNKELWINCKGREHVKVNLENTYTFNWEKFDKWYFLEISV